MAISSEAVNRWGGSGRSDNRPSLLDLIRNGTLDLETASLLWLLVAKKSSIVVAAAPQLAGKTTLLTAIMDFMPPRYRIVYTRGQAEDFSFLSVTGPSNTYILVPELSDHTPAYLWGDKVRTLFDALGRGYSLAATIHADSPQEVMGMLEGPPVYIPPRHLCRVQFVVNLHMNRKGRAVECRLSALTATVTEGDPEADGPGLLPLVRWDHDGGTFLHDTSVATRGVLAMRLGIDLYQVCLMGPCIAIPALRRTHGERGHLWRHHREMVLVSMETQRTRLAETLSSWLNNAPIDEPELHQMVTRHYGESSMS